MRRGGAVTGGQNVVMAGHMAVLGQIVGILGEGAIAVVIGGQMKTTHGGLDFVDVFIGGT